MHQSSNVFIDQFNHRKQRYALYIATEKIIFRIGPRYIKQANKKIEPISEFGAISPIGSIMNFYTILLAGYRFKYSIIKPKFVLNRNHLNFRVNSTHHTFDGVKSTGCSCWAGAARALIMDF